MEMMATETLPVRLFTILELDDGREIDVKIRQAGREDVRLDSTVPLEVGRLIVLRIDDDHGETWYRAVAEVHWSNSIRGGSSVGLFLNEPLSERLLSRPEWDRRESLRYPMDVPARIWWEDARTSTPARIVNYSTHGVGLLCKEPATLGRRSIIATGLRGDEMACVSATSRWQVQVKGGVVVGFELESQQGKRLCGLSVRSRNSISPRPVFTFHPKAEPLTVPCRAELKFNQKPVPAGV